MQAQIIITPCVLENGTRSAIVAVSNRPFPVVVDLDNLGKFVTDIITPKCSEKSIKTNKV